MIQLHAMNDKLKIQTTHSVTYYLLLKQGWDRWADT